MVEENSFVDKENKKLTGSASSPRKSAQSGQITKRFSNNSKTVSSKKEDADVAVEINITSTQNIQVDFFLSKNLHVNSKVLIT